MTSASIDLRKWALIIKFAKFGIYNKFKTIFHVRFVSEMLLVKYTNLQIFTNYGIAYIKLGFEPENKIKR